MHTSHIHASSRGNFREGGSRFSQERPNQPQQPTLPLQGHTNDASMMKKSRVCPWVLRELAYRKADTMLFRCHHRCSSVQKERLEPAAMDSWGVRLWIEEDSG
eukprot:510761-Pelagomonas_calceolata.AAC.2